MNARLLINVLCAALLIAAACDRESRTTSDAVPAKAAPIAGMYDVSGSTVETATR